jgi:uncharacterized damage-inducible protein DinB
MSEPEVWLRGPIPDLAPLLQPVGHSLLQCRNEVHAVLPALTAEQVWQRPGGAASVGYHARHAVGSLDRLLTYARGEQLTPAQLRALADEGRVDASERIADELVGEFDAAIELAMGQLRATDESTLLDSREVGRGRLPSTVIGLLVHAAEHTQRHVGQLTTTVKVVLGAA